MTATVEQVGREWMRLLKLAQEGEEVLITRNGKTIAKLTGVQQQKHERDRQGWLIRLAKLREKTSTGQPSASVEAVLDGLRSERN
jgi:antitoxin (DNA-binding transcriptional repressor) of toxin-antitoxin stability system